MIDSRTAVTIVLINIVIIVLNSNNCQCNLSGYCGLTRYDINNETVKKFALRTNSLEDFIVYQQENVPEMYRIIDTRNTRNNRQAQDRFEMILSRLIPVLMVIKYDSSFEAEFPDEQVRENYIRNLVYEAQLIYEQREFYDILRFHFVVIAIEKITEEFPVDLTGNKMMDAIRDIRNQRSNRNFYSTVMLIYKNIIAEGKVLGIATTGTFCRFANSPSVVLVNAYALNSAVVLAHEFGHAINMYHDGQEAGPAAICKGKYIMSTVAGRGVWSRCSLKSAIAYLVSTPVYECLFDETRLAWAASPVSEKFDFKPDSENRRPYPGEQVSLDEQCQLALDTIAQSLSDNYDVCDNLPCNIDGFYTMIGPALTGSDCLMNKTRTHGKCKSQICAPP